MYCSCDNHVCITKYQSPPDSPELDIDFVNKYNLILVVNNQTIICFLFVVHFCYLCFVFVMPACLLIATLRSPCDVFLCYCHFPVWWPGSGVEFNCIDS